MIEIDALQTFARDMLPALEQEMRTVLAPPAASPSLPSEPATSLRSVQALSLPKGSAQAPNPQGGQTAPDPFYGMLHYHMGWVDAELRPANVPNGKRIRPLLCLLTCQAAAESVQVATRSGSYNSSSVQARTWTPDTWTPEHPLAWHHALPAAAAVELLHNFSLIHDDIEDASPTRRGRDTLWKIWGVEQAINSGDALFALAHLALSRLGDRGIGAGIVLHALRRFDQTCLHLTRGQHADIDFETRDQVSVAEYVEMIAGKTAALLSLSAELGALVGGADPAVVHHYAAFGRDLGLAFQVKDDILGIWGDEAHIGKSAATDIAARKKTLPVLYALSQSPQLRQLYRQPQTGSDFVPGFVPGFVPQVMQLLDQSGARDFAGASAARYSQSALDHLEAAQPAGAAGAALFQLAHMLLNRDF